MFFSKKKRSRDELYYRQLAKQNLPWRILKATAIIVFVVLVLFSYNDFQFSGKSGYHPSDTGRPMAQPIDLLHR